MNRTENQPNYLIPTIGAHLLFAYSSDLWRQTGFGPHTIISAESLCLPQKFQFTNIEYVYARGERFDNPFPSSDGIYFLALLSILTGGKDAILKPLSEQSGLVSQIVTATTRPRREDDAPNSYIFMTPQEFNGTTLAEFEQHGNHLYGTPVSSIQKAAQSQQTFLTWRGEIDGLKNLKNYLGQNDRYQNIPFISLFILPVGRTPIEILSSMIQQRGIVEAIKWRGRKIAKEILRSAQISDIIVPNDFSKPDGLNQTINTMSQLLLSIKNQTFSLTEPLNGNCE